MKKTVFITNIIRAIFVLMLLILIFTRNGQLGIHLMIVSFMLLTACYIAKNICNLFNKPIGAKFFHKLFVILFILFEFGFLIVWSYAWIKEKEYFPILFTIPFWIFGIYTFRKSILGIKPSIKQNKKKFKFDFRIVVSCSLVICVLLSGVICLVIGIRNTYRINKNTKNYLTTTGYFKDYEIYNSQKNLENTKTGAHTTYRLIYSYKVEGKEYSIKTDYGSSSIPSINSSRKIKYNPSNPSDAVLIGTNGNNVLIYFGAFFLLGGTVFALAFLYIIGVFDKVKINILGLYIGFVSLIIGIGIISFQMGEVSTLIETIKRLEFWTLIPIMFITIGSFQIIKCLFFERLEANNSKKKKV